MNAVFKGRLNIQICLFVKPGRRKKHRFVCKKKKKKVIDFVHFWTLWVIEIYAYLCCGYATEAEHQQTLQRPCYYGNIISNQNSQDKRAKFSTNQNGFYCSD